jgi:hypothetical protein
MKEKIVKYRTWYKGVPPRPIKLKIPGWAGENRKHSNGTEPQPWHCTPFVDGCIYGYELIYPFESECRVSLKNGEITFEGDFKNDTWNSNKSKAPMSTFAKNHYGMSSSLDLEPPEGYVIRTETHPRFYTDTTGTCPIMLPGHIHRWWSRIFFVVFKAPKEGEMHIFRHGEPYGQVLFVPEKSNFSFVQMTMEEEKVRSDRERCLSDHGSKICTHAWRDNKGNQFDNKYKVLSSAYLKNGEEEVEKVIKESLIKKNKDLNIKNIKKRFFSHEKIYKKTAKCKKNKVQ